MRLKRRPPGPQSQTSKRRSERDGLRGLGWGGGGLEQPGQIRANAPRPANGARAAVSWGCGCGVGGWKGCWGESWGQTGSGDSAVVGGPGPPGRVHGPVSPGVKRTPGPQRPWCCSQQTRTCSLGLEGVKEELALTPAPVLCPCPHLPRRNRRDAVRTAGLNPPPHPTALPGRGPWANDAP